MTDKIEEIRERWRGARRVEVLGCTSTALTDIQTLLAEVDRLRDAYDTGYADGAGTRGEHRGVRYKMKP